VIFCKIFHPLRDLCDLRVKNHRNFRFGSGGTAETPRRRDDFHTFMIFMLFTVEEFRNFTMKDMKDMKNGTKVTLRDLRASV
jgi:hypothetical protein